MKALARINLHRASVEFPYLKGWLIYMKSSNWSSSYVKSQDVSSFYLGLVALGLIMLSPFCILMNSSLFLVGCVIPFISLVASVVGLFLAYRAKIKGVSTKRLFFSFIINGAALIFSIAACILIAWIFSFGWGIDQGRFGDYIGN